MNTDERRFDLLTERVLGAIFDVSNTLGAGFLSGLWRAQGLVLEWVQAQSERSVCNSVTLCYSRP
jgi:hypothetical protein